MEKEYGMLEIKASRLCLYRVLIAGSVNEDLANSYYDGRVVLVKGEGGERR